MNDDNVSVISSVLVEKTSSRLLLFLLINMSFGTVELLYGLWSNSLGLVSDAFHMFFDCTALIAGLVASVISRWNADEYFTYGYVRAEIIAGFTNGLFLLFVAFFIFSEAMERVLEPPDVQEGRVFFVSIIGLVINIIGVCFFHHGHSHKAAHDENIINAMMSRRDTTVMEYNQIPPNLMAALQAHSHTPGTANRRRSEERNSLKLESSQTEILHGVFLHIIADTLGSFGVIVSSFLIYEFGWMIADPLCSMFISALIVASVIPLLSDSLCVLMQRTPKSLDRVLPRCYDRVMRLTGVYGVYDQHFWTLCTEVYVGGVTLEVAMDADCEYIRTQTHYIFSRAGVRQLYVQIERVSEDQLHEHSPGDHSPVEHSQPQTASLSLFTATENG